MLIHNNKRRARAAKKKQLDRRYECERRYRYKGRQGYNGRDTEAFANLVEHFVWARKLVFSCILNFKFNTIFFILNYLFTHFQRGVFIYVCIFICSIMSFYSPLYLSAIHLTSSDDVEFVAGFLFIYGSAFRICFRLDCHYDI